MKLVTKTLSAAAAAALALTLASCSVPANNGGTGDNGGSNQGQSAEDQKQKEALELYADAERAQIPTIHEMYPGMYKDVAVETELPGTIIFKYVYAEEQDGPAVATELDKMDSTFESTADSAIFPSMKQAGAQGKLTVRYTYANPNGAEIWSKEFQSK